MRRSRRRRRRGLQILHRRIAFLEPRDIALVIHGWRRRNHSRISALGEGRRSRTLRRRGIGDWWFDQSRRLVRATALDPHTTADKHPAQKDHYRGDRRHHKHEDQLLAVELDLVECVFLHVSCQVRGIVPCCAEMYQLSEAQRVGSFSMSRLASADDGSRMSARSSSARAATLSLTLRYASPRATWAATLSSLQSEILSASIASRIRPPRRWMRPTSRWASASYGARKRARFNSVS